MVQVQYEGQSQIIFDVQMPTVGLTSEGQPDDGLGDEFQGTFLSLQLEIETEKSISDALIHVQDRATASSQIAEGSHERIVSQTVLLIENGTNPTRESAEKDFCNRYGSVISFCFTRDACEFRVLKSKIDHLRVKRQVEYVFQTLFGKLETRIHEIHSLNPLDWKELRDRNGKAPQRVDMCVHDAIQEQCLRRPHAPAICSYEGEMTYEQLFVQATRVAKCLQARGVGPEKFVPLCFPKTRWAVISILGVMLAGGAFVLLETAYPLARLKDICQKLEPAVILSVKSTSDLAQNLAPDVLIVDDEDSMPPDAAATSFQESSVKPYNSVYVAFTSGSTGSPKGVVIQHHAYCSAVGTHIEKFHIDVDSRVLQFSSYGFDAAVLKTLSTLMAGGCLCVLGDAQRTDSFVESSHAMRPSHAFLTPSFIRSLTPEEFEYIGIHTLVFIGEKVTPSSLLSCPKNVRAINGYGPAECTPITSIHPDIRAATSPSNIGWSQFSTCWIVDPRDHNQLVPIGAIGELIVEGWTVGRGYLKDEAMTQAAFISSPKWLTSIRGSEETPPLYKTGDLVQELPDKSLLYAGRKGTQAKLRGQRLELEEVETHCRGYFPEAIELVADVTSNDDNSFLVLVVVIRPTSEGFKNHKFLLPPTDDFVDLAQAAKEGLKRTLPTFMVPTIILPFDELPTNSSGKMDRQQLRRCITSLSSHELRKYQPLAQSKSSPVLLSGIEGVLQGIWAKELHIARESVGPDDNFFILGGNSISAMRVVSKARSQNLLLVASDLLSYPSLSALAKHATPTKAIAFDTTPFSLLGATPESLNRFHAKLREEHIIPNGAQIVDSAPLTTYQYEMLDTNGVESFVFFYDGPVSKRSLRKACQTVWDAYTILRTVFVPMDDRIVQIALSNVDLPFYTIETNEDVESMVTSSAKESCQRSSLGPLGASFTLVSGQHGRKNGFIITLSHLQYDGVSLQFLFDDITLAYGGEVPAPRLDYFNYLYFRAQHSLDKAFSAWKHYLKDAPVNRLLEEHHPGSSHPPQGTAWCPIQEQTIPIPSFPQTLTLATLVRAGWAIALSERYHELDILFQQTVHGRDSVLENVHHIFGPCINKLPFRIAINATDSVQEFLTQVQEQQSKALRYDYLEMPEILQRCTPWPKDTRMAWHLLHQNFDATWNCRLDGVDSLGQEFFDGRAPKSESGLGICTVQGKSLHLVITEVATPGDSGRAEMLLRRWTQLVETLAVSMTCPLESIIELQSAEVA